MGASPALGEPTAVADKGPLTVSAIVVAEARAPLASVAVKMTLKLPATVYVCVGFCRVELVPSPKLQAKVNGASPPAGLPAKVTASGAMPEVGLPVEVALSVGLTVIAAVVAVAVRPAASVTVRLGWYVPATVKVWLGFWVVAVPPSPKVQA